MRITGWKNRAVWVIGSLVLGALGSGLWKQGFRPMWQWPDQAILTAATLGSATVSDSIYREAARGLHEAPAIGGLSMLIAFYTCTCLVCTGVVLVSFDYQRVYGKSKEKVGTNEEIEADRLKSDISRRKRVMKMPIFTVAVLSLFGSGYLSINCLELSAANGAYTFFAQSIAICRPYMDDQQARLLESRFASVQGKAEYIELTNSLRKIADSNHRKLPKFKPWFGRDLKCDLWRHDV